MHFTKTYIQDLSQHMNTACAESPLICPYAGLTSRSRTQASSSDRACAANRITSIQQLDMGVLSSLERPQASIFGFTTNERDINSSNAVGQEPNREFTDACLQMSAVCASRQHKSRIHPQTERVLPIASQAFSNWTWGFSPPWNATPAKSRLWTHNK